MGDSRNILIKLFLIVFIFCTLIYAVSAQENETKDSIQQEAGITTTLNETISDLSQNTDGDSTIEVQSNFDKSLDIFNVVATLLGVLVTILSVIITVLAVIIAIVGGLGFLEIRKWREIRTNIDEDVTVIKETRHKAEDYLYKLRNDTKIQISSLNERPSGDVMKNLDDFASRLELLEIMGASLSSEDYFSRATDFYFKGKYELALTAIEKAIELNPDNSNMWSNKGLVLSNLNRHDEALKAVENSIELDPDDSDLWYNKGIVLSNFDRDDEALKSIEKAIELKPSDSMAWLNKGIILRDLGRHELALKSTEKAIELEPANFNAWDNKGLLLHNLGRNDEALKSIGKAN
jgi:tetratricopeptide (TPR) repeat protein